MFSTVAPRTKIRANAIGQNREMQPRSITSYSSGHVDRGWADKRIRMAVSRAHPSAEAQQSHLIQSTCIQT